MASERDDVDVIERATAYRGWSTTWAYRLKHRRFDGDWSPTISREVCDRGDAAGLIPYDPVRDALVLVEQFRPGAFHAGRHPWMIEIVAGMIGPGEPPIEVARRECLEEIGLAASEIVPVLQYMPSPGGLSEVVHLFCGRVDAGAAPAFAGLAEEHEDLRIHVVPWRAARRGLDQGRFVNGLTVIALQWLARHRLRLRRQETWT